MRHEETGARGASGRVPRGGGMIGSGFTVNTSVFLDQFGVSEDGCALTFSVGVGSSMGFVRGIGTMAAERSRVCFPLMRPGAG